MIWINATMSTTAFALGLAERSSEFKNAFVKMQPAKWQIDTFEESREQLVKLGVVKGSG